MDQYKDMYYKLFNKITDIVCELENIQKDTEEMFILRESTHNQVNNEE